MNYQENCKVAAQQGAMLGSLVVPAYNPTVGENIDAKIEMHRKEIERLEESKKTLGPLLGMRISDIRDAMNY